MILKKPRLNKSKIIKSSTSFYYTMKKTSKIYVAWHNGLVWSAIVRELQSQWFTNIIQRSHKELDLTDQSAVKDFFSSERPEYVFLAAAKVWGIMANNSFPADFIYQNLQIQNNVIHESYKHGVEKLLFLWSSCIFPKQCEQPIQESFLLTGPLEQTNEPYAIAKIAGIKMCQSYNRQYGTNFIACMPTNLYGPWDNFDLTSSHVVPALIRKFHEAKVTWTQEVVCRWDGSPMREFLYVDDMAEACIYLMNNFNPTIEQNNSWDIFFNNWTGSDISIKSLAETIKQIVWYEWEINWDTTKPNGTMRKLLDVSKLNLQWWKAKTWLEEWIQKAYLWFLNQ